MALTMQQIFDKCITHLRTQKVPSIEAGDCLYRGPNGLKCAVGALITDEAYKDSLEDLPVREDKVIRALVESGVLYEECLKHESVESDKIDLLSDLQHLHDTCMFDGEEYFEEEILKVSKRHNVEIPPLV